jgi:hypothetical protein
MPRVTHSLKKSHSIPGMLNFITMLTKACHWIYREQDGFAHILKFYFQE